jgi:hypothetical protein
VNALRTLLGLVVLLVAGFVGPQVASAKSVIGAETRVGVFNLDGQVGTGVETDAGAGVHRAFGDAEYDFTSRSPHAARAGASSALQGAQLSRHLAQLEKYGKAGFKELQNGRIRYFGELKTAAKQGEMAGRRLVREWNPATNATRTWHETLDHAGRVRIVRPETGGPKVHYMFDELGNFTGTF